MISKHDFLRSMGIGVAGLATGKVVGDEPVASKSELSDCRRRGFRTSPSASCLPRDGCRCCRRWNGRFCRQLRRRERTLHLFFHVQFLAHRENRLVHAILRIIQTNDSPTSTVSMIVRVSGFWFQVSYSSHEDHTRRGAGHSSIHSSYGLMGISG